MVFCDLPDAGPFSHFIQNLFACLAEQEREWISTRTKNALKMLKARGVRLGTPQPEKAVAAMTAARRQRLSAFAKATRPVVNEIMQTGATSPSEIARCLNRRGIPTANGRKWWPNTVKNLQQFSR
jgi:DNA invertase Pin-like site-specific DNA recombinase